MKRHLISNNAVIRTVLTAFISCATLSMSAQQLQCKYEVKKGETLFAIAQRYGVTIKEITNANPAMKQASYVLQAGSTINIPVHGNTASAATQAKQEKPAQPTTQVTAQAPSQQITNSSAQSPASKSVFVGVMLPLHDINGDGRRMTEYYRGMLLALNELKSEGISVEMNTWNVPEDGDVQTALKANRASKCDVIFGPLYTKMVPEMASFCKQHNIKLVIPFSIKGDDVKTCPNIYQVYQSQDDIDTQAINDFVALFRDEHPVFIDCNYTASHKGVFTAALRAKLDKEGIQYSITNSNNSLDIFAKAFSADKKNIVVLNSGRSQELGQVIKLLDQLTASKPSTQISLFGYNEWFMYAKVYKDKFKKYDTYVPSVYDYNAATPAVQKIEKDYQTYFGSPMQEAIPRFALTGYDQLMFFVKGISQYGSQFNGLSTQNTYTPVQTPYSFQKLSNGGYQNRTFLLVRYK